MSRRCVYGAGRPAVASSLRHSLLSVCRAVRGKLQVRVSESPRPRRVASTADHSTALQLHCALGRALHALDRVPAACLCCLCRACCCCCRLSTLCKSPPDRSLARPHADAPPFDAAQNTRQPRSTAASRQRQAHTEAHLPPDTRAEPIRGAVVSRSIAVVCPSWPALAHVLLHLRSKKAASRIETRLNDSSNHRNRDSMSSDASLTFGSVITLSRPSPLDPQTDT